MNIIDAVTLSKDNAINDNTNMLIWDQETGYATRYPVLSLLNEIGDMVNLDNIEEEVARANSNATGAKNSVTGLNSELERLANKIDTLQAGASSADLNNLAEKIGNLNALTTSANGTLVKAINEVNSRAMQALDAIDDIDTTSTNTTTTTVVTPDVLSAYGMYYVDSNIPSNIDTSNPSNANTITSTIQKMIDNASADGGGTIVFGNKLYCLTGLTLKSKVMLKGAGKGATILQKVRGNQSYFIFVPETETNIAITDMSIVGVLVNDSSGVTGGNIMPDDGAKCNGIHFEDMLYSDGTPHTTHDYDKNKNPLTKKSQYEALYSHSTVEKRTWTYRNSVIDNVAIIGFTGSGLYVGYVNYSVFAFDVISYLNKRHGMELWCTDCFFIQIVCEKNGRCGIFSEAGNTKFMCIKSIWNGWDSIGKKYTTDAEINEVANDAHTKELVSNEWISWGIFAFCSRCSFIDVEVQDNFCGGVYIRGNNAHFTNLVSDCNGYGKISADVENPSQQYPLIKITDSGELIVNATCSQYRTKRNNSGYIHKPVAKYGLLIGSLFNSIINCGCTYYGISKCAVTPYHHEPQGNSASEWFHGNVITITGNNPVEATGVPNVYLGVVQSDNV